jgi:predicted ABC-type transport system involved in lysophospholipase L1 biosynthesis ATPase subunit
VGYIFQQFNLLPYLSVLDNVLLPCRFSALRAQRAQRPGRCGAGAAAAQVACRARCGRAAPTRCRWASSSAWPRRGR